MGRLQTELGEFHDACVADRMLSRYVHNGIRPKAKKELRSLARSHRRQTKALRTRLREGALTSVRRKIKPRILKSLLSVSANPEPA